MKQGYAVMDDRENDPKIIAVFNELSKAKEYFQTINFPSCIYVVTFKTKSMRLKRE